MRKQNKRSVSTVVETKYYTKEGLDKLKEELNRLKTVERPLISQQIAEARDKGDLSENAEYDAAKNAQSMLELKISKLENLVSNSRILDESKLDNSKVLIFSRVKIRNQKSEADITYLLVPESEADLKTGKIAVTSPIARGLLGKKVNDLVEINVPAGTMTFEIIEISR